MERSCAKDFGKESGAIHEGIITLRNLGLTAEGWEKMKDDKELAKKVVELLEGEKEAWLKKILAQERACYLAFFDCEWDLKAFATTLKRYGESKIRFWQKLGLEPHFLPEIVMSQNVSYRGWKIKLELESQYYQAAAEGKILRNVNDQLTVDKEPFKLEGIVVLIDTRLKPRYNNGKQMYKDDNLLGPIIEQLRKDGEIAKYDHGPQSSRFGISADEWEGHIKSALTDKLGLETKQVRLERAIEANIIPQLYVYMLRKDDGETNTWEWREEYFEDRGNRLFGGYSDYGGLARVCYYASEPHRTRRSVRPLAVL